ncbi:MAG: DNA repair protein RadC [Actinobacteria bacterium]|jgi:DNA repair protein RadC|nr:DNA repair protein RadC [Actinomycetota bacterium]
MTNLAPDLRVDSPAATGGGVCPHCAGEGARIYRPGAPEERREITSPEDAADILKPMLDGLDREHCVTLNLDTKHRLIAATTVSIGSVDHTFMSPREVFRDALLHGAAALVLAHNHPSGDPEPSRDDGAVTRRLGRAGNLIGIEVLDHLVVGSDRWVSLARLGALTARGPERSFELDGGRSHGRQSVSSLDM